MRRTVGATGRVARYSILKWGAGGAAAALIAGLLSVGPVSAVVPQAPPEQKNRTLFTLAIDGQISYRDNAAEQLPWGPAGLAVSEDGTVWIIDGAAHRLLGFSQTGRPRGVVDLDDRVVGIGGLATFGPSLVVLDSAAEKPQVLVVDSATGKTSTRIELPASAYLDQGLSGVGVEADGTIYAELEGGASIVRVARVSTGTPVAARVAPDKASGLRLGVGTVRVKEHTNWRVPAEIDVNGQIIAVESSNKEITARIAGATRDELFLDVAETSQDSSGKLMVDSTIRLFSPQGKPIGVARVPKGEVIRATTTSITPDGRILALVADLAAVSVVELGVVPPGQLPEVLPDPAPPERIVAGAREGKTQAASAEPQTAAAATACVSRSTMASRDSTYRSNSHYYSSTNISGACANRGKPRYLGSAGTYSSVPYQWGGFDTVSSFNAQMSPGTGKAGDITKGDTLSCAHGIDCSGFVSRIWGLSSKKSTTSLTGVSAAIPNSWLQPYDIFLTDGHTMLYRSRGSGGYYVSESTTKDSKDRVIYQFQGASYVDGFTTRRSSTVCCNPNVEPCP